MKVALDISPIKSGHKVRGIGAYTKYLLRELQKVKNSSFELELFEDPASPPPADVIHYPYFDLFQKTLPNKVHGSRVVTIHDVIPLVFPNYFPVGPKGFLSLFFQKRAIKNIEAIICDSKTSKADITSKLSISPDKIHVIYLAPASVFRKKEQSSKLIAKKYQLPKDFILYVGDVNWNKNLVNLLEALKISQKNLVMVGKAITDNDLVETKQANLKIAQLGLEDKVTKTGYIKDSVLVEIYNLAKATLQPSFYEGFGLPTLESMACGTPVIISNVASLSEIAGPDAIFCDPTDPHDIATKIEKVYAMTKKEKESLSEKLIKHASIFTWSKVARETISVYKSVCR